MCEQAGKRGRNRAAAAATAKPIPLALLSPCTPSIRSIWQSLLCSASFLTLFYLNLSYIRLCVGAAVVVRSGSGTKRLTVCAPASRLGGNMPPSPLSLFLCLAVCPPLPSPNSQPNFAAITRPSGGRMDARTHRQTYASPLVVVVVWLGPSLSSLRSVRLPDRPPAAAAATETATAVAAH